MIFIDADHFYKAVLNDICESLKLLACDDIIVGHDCEYRLSESDTAMKKFVDANLNQDSVKSATESFLEMHCGVVKAVGEFKNQKRLFCEEQMTIHVGGEIRSGYSSMWVLYP